MFNPAKVITKQFVRLSSTTLLAFGMVVSLIDFIALYSAAAKEGVLHIDQGIGLLNNYGLISTLIGNAISLYVAKKYYEGVCSIETSKVVVDTSSIEPSLRQLKAMIKAQGRYQLSLYLMVSIGAIFWARNLKNVISNPEITWGHKVFDSWDHPLTFTASRIHNLYAWLIIMPLVAHVMIWSSIQLRRVITAALRQDALKYDLLNPDQRGGFGFVDRAHLGFNIVIAFIYIQITMHIETFRKINSEHVIDYIVLTILLLLINRIFLGQIYGMIKTLRVQSLNVVKDKVFKEDKLSFEILKYCYERRIGALSVVNFIIKAVAIASPGIIKLWPFVAKVFSRA